eukprot:COSAG04_NODE_19150_length_423_cov_1.083333_1_plen_24_part_10
MTSVLVKKYLNATAGPVGGARAAP